MARKVSTQFMYEAMTATTPGVSCTLTRPLDADAGQRFLIGLEAGVSGDVDLPAIGKAGDDAELLLALHRQDPFAAVRRGR